MTVTDWAESNWIVPETGEPIVLRPWQRAVLVAMFPSDGSASAWETFLISTVKKAGKTTLNAIATLYAVLTRPGETAYVVANDLDQSVGRVFELIADEVRRMDLVRTGAAEVTRTQIVLPETRSRIVAIPADFAGAAGALFGITSWTELWAFRHEGHVRLWEELTPIPNRRSLRIVDSYAGFSGDAPVLEPLWQRALEGDRLDDDLPVYAKGGLWAYIDQGVEAQQRGWLGDPRDMDAYYREQVETLRPGTFARLHLNQWQSGEEAFITAEDWEACVDPFARPPVYPDTIGLGPLHVGVDVGTKHDSSAVVAVGMLEGKLRLVRHRIWQPVRGETLDLEQTVEAFLLDLARDFPIRTVRYDPSQMVRSAATLRGKLPMHEFAQTSANLTTAGQTLFELLKTRALTMYPDLELRGHALNAVAVNSGRGWRLAKEKSSRKIDGLAALSFACVDAFRAMGPLPEAEFVEHGRWDSPAGSLNRMADEAFDGLRTDMRL